MDDSAISMLLTTRPGWDINLETICRQCIYISCACDIPCVGTHKINKSHHLKIRIRRGKSSRANCTLAHIQLQIIAVASRHVAVAMVHGMTALPMQRRLSTSDM